MLRNHGNMIGITERYLKSKNIDHLDKKEMLQTFVHSEFVATIFQFHVLVLLLFSQFSDIPIFLSLVQNIYHDGKSILFVFIQNVYHGLTNILIRFPLHIICFFHKNVGWCRHVCKTTATSPSQQREVMSYSIKLGDQNYRWTKNA